VSLLAIRFLFLFTSFNFSFWSTSRVTRECWNLHWWYGWLKTWQTSWKLSSSTCYRQWSSCPSTMLHGLELILKFGLVGVTLGYSWFQVVKVSWSASGLVGCRRLQFLTIIDSMRFSPTVLSGRFTLGCMTIFNHNFMTLVIKFSLKIQLDPSLPNCPDTEVWKISWNSMH
jgi:hypothetical protein